MSGSPLPQELHVPIHAAYDGVTKHGRHLSSAIEDLFRTVQPDRDNAERLRHVLVQAVRYGDVNAALDGSLLDVVDGERLYLPDWLRARLTASLGATTSDFLHRSAGNAPTFIRVNTLKTSVGECLDALASFQPTPIEHEVMRIDAPFGLFRSDAFQHGWFEQQDITSQQVSRSLAPQPKMRVVDSCAGAGGKSLHLAAMMQNRGRVIAMDIVDEKLEHCRRRAARAGADIIETRLIDTTKVVKRQANTADRVLIDAPCTGTGVLRRNADIPWHLTEGGFAELLETQQQLLRLHSRMVKTGGTLVYATCSVLNEEGPDQVRAFLHDHDAFTCAEEWSTLPGDRGGDAFYVAVLTRSDAS